MNEMVSHIEFLLHTHNCVIVPGLGGFVVNTTPARKKGLSDFLSPVCELVFNRELSYNDGLLVESFMRVEKISFEAAQMKIDTAVKQLKNNLRENKVADLGDLGVFRMTDTQRFSYFPKPFVRPDYFGLSTASLKPIIQLQPKNSPAQKQQAEKKNTWKKIGVGAAAAVAIAFVLLLFPIQDTDLRHQTAQIITESGLFGNKMDKPKAGTAVLETIERSDIEHSTSNPTIEVADSQIADSEQVENSEILPRYYIVTGVYEVREFADKMIAQLKEEGYGNPSTIEKSGRISVFSESFPTIEEAYNALNKLVKQNKNHRDAWVLKR